MGAWQQSIARHCVKWLSLVDTEKCWCGGRKRETRTAMQQSLCETCAHLREIKTPKGSRYLLCQLSQTDARYPKYPVQPVVRCDGYRTNDRSAEKRK